MTKTFCDRCGKEIYNGIKPIIVELWFGGSTYGNQVEKKTLELCMNCFDGLARSNDRFMITL